MPESPFIPEDNPHEMNKTGLLLAIILVSVCSLHAQKLVLQMEAGVRQNESFILEGGQLGVGLGLQFGERLTLLTGIRYARREQNYQVLGIGIGNRQPAPVLIETMGTVQTNFVEFPFTLRYDLFRQDHWGMYGLGGAAWHDALLQSPVFANQQILLNPEIGHFWSGFGGLG